MAAFDRTPANLAALKAEVENDPESRGYIAALAVKTEDMIDLLNEKVSTTNKPVEDLDVIEIAAVIDPAEYGALNEYNKEFVKMFINRPDNETLRPFVSKMVSMFPGGGSPSATFAAIQALRSVSVSRVELITKVGVVVTRDDWIAAKGS